MEDKIIQRFINRIDKTNIESYSLLAKKYGVTKALIRDIVKKSDEDKWDLYKEDLILEFTEVIYVEMARRSITKAQLAHRLGKPTNFITRFLQGKNINLKTIAMVTDALKVKVKIKLCEHSENI